MFGKNILAKKEKEKDGELNINSMFYTIQGEGPNAGEPAYFIRLQGCNLRCSFCDTEFDSGNPISIHDVVTYVLEDAQIASRYKRPLIVITGGEPMLQADLPDLVTTFLSKGFRVQIETAGTVWQEEFNLPRFLVSEFQIVCSPKTGKINPKLEARLTAYKYVLRADQVSPDDGLPDHSPESGGRLILHRPKNKDIPVYVMPCDEHNEALTMKNEQACVESAMEFGYTICLQMHKELGVD